LKRGMILIVIMASYRVVGKTRKIACKQHTHQALNIIEQDALCIALSGLKAPIVHFRLNMLEHFM
jgi:hypothetical protein